LSRINFTDRNAAISEKFIEKQAVFYLLTAWNDHPILMDEIKKNRKRMRIQSIDRAVGILNLFRNNKTSLSLAEIASAMRIAKTTIHTIVKTLEYNGFLHQDIYSKKYSLGFALFELGTMQAANLTINRNASKPMHVLANDTDACCRLAIWDADTVFVTMTVTPHGQDTQFRQMGPRLPAYCTALGKAMLSHMPDKKIASYLEATTLSSYTMHTITDKDAFMEDLVLTRKRGYSVSNREILLHQVGIGAPVFSEEGSVIGAVSLNLNPEETTAELIDKTSTRLLRTAYEISAEMGYQPLSVMPKPY
jgi:DNA-binding IclR family transcriptional regulator